MALRINQIPIDDEYNSTSGGTETGEVYAINSKSFMPITGQQTTDMSSKFRYKLVLKIYDSTGSTLHATFKQRPNTFSTTSPTAIFDIRGILNSLTSFTYYSQSAGQDPNNEPPIHEIGMYSTTLISRNSGNYITFRARLSEEYSETQNGDLVENNGPQVTLAAVKTAFDQFNYWGNTYAFPDQFQAEKYQQTYFDRRFLSVLPASYNKQNIYDYRKGCLNENGGVLTGYIQYVERYYDLHTLALWNRGNGYTYVNHIKFTFRKKDGTKCKISGTDFTDVYFQINDSNGAFPYATTNQTDADSLIFVGVGGRNIRGMNAQSHYVNLYDEETGLFTSTNTVDWGPFEHEEYDYYEVSGWSAVGQNANIQQKTKVYYFVHDDNKNCKGEEVIRLGWINHLGTYDYFNFTGSWTESWETKTKGVEPVVGADSLSSDRYRIRPLDGKKAVTSVMTRKAKLRTGELSEHENILIQSLLSSPEVFYIFREQQVEYDYGGISKKTMSQRVYIEKQSYTKQYKSKKDKVKYEIDICFSNAVLTNTI
ncbi:MAG: hypothetical protein Unbinned3987contig1001_43 [Prokaryotic dsDNA virus sp.]|jgi:hypothetical protein|nr:MAG: hypothetical protein Unbinned3987contig1001_43 [Prokaryotic dsDNA virus sp.]|tara:strand:- start:6546 stop:8159 length:1614 start_codon:yes stop_codon:yes gene_type:complete